jgi:hypothetical protein
MGPADQLQSSTLIPPTVGYISTVKPPEDTGVNPAKLPRRAFGVKLITSLVSTPVAVIGELELLIQVVAGTDDPRLVKRYVPACTVCAKVLNPTGIGICIATVPKAPVTVCKVSKPLVALPNTTEPDTPDDPRANIGPVIEALGVVQDDPVGHIVSFPGLEAPVVLPDI